MAKPEVKIVFLGTPEFAVPVLLKLIKSGYAPALVVTQPDKPAGRGRQLISPPIKKIALEHKLKLAQPKNKKELSEIFSNLDCDLGILAAFGQILPSVVLNRPRLGIINLHPSLLPRYRGSSPIQSAIINGDKETGISIIKLSDRLDAGPIIGQAEVALDQTEDSQSLHDKLASLGAELLVKILPGYLSGQTELKEQDENQASFTGQISRDDGRVNWQESSLIIERRFRAYLPWPGSFTLMDGKRVKIVKLSVLEPYYEDDIAPGTVFLAQNGQVAVKCRPGAAVLDNIQLEGKKAMPANDFIKGNKLIGKIFK